MGHDFQAANDRQLVNTKEVNDMAKYLVRVAIPTVYIIDASDEQDAMHQAAERFKKEQNTWLEPELQWAELKGSASEAEWVIDDWGELPL
jgi:hypothetical protein